jgi:hypothetical protein
MNKQAHLKTILSLLGFAAYIYAAINLPSYIFLAVTIGLSSVCLYLVLYNFFKS